MDGSALRHLLEEVAAGRRPPDEAFDELRRLPFADLGFARIDHHRALRQAVPEAVYGPGKSPVQLAAIVTELLSSPGPPVIVTRASPEQVEAASAAARRAGGGEPEVLGTDGSLLVWRPAPERAGRVVVVTAGTSDLPVADECQGVLRALGFRPERLDDCGVAGVHRILGSIDQLAEADAVVVVAGMEGALASVVGGITPAPVVAVPTSAGYGSGLGGVTALLAMTASCAAGITVVGIDNGFGAGCAVARLLR